MMTEDRNAPKYPKPKILLVDMYPECEKVLQDAGYNVNVGTFGQSYSVPKSGAYELVPMDTVSLPNLQEQEIVIVNMQAPEPIPYPEEDLRRSDIRCFWQKCEYGLIDPRPLLMQQARESLDRILAHGGIFVVFCSTRIKSYFISAKWSNGLYSIDKEFSASNWDWLTAFSGIPTKSMSGEEIDYNNTRFGRMLQRGSAEANYSCFINHEYDLKTDQEWVLPLCTNKYGKDVGTIYGKDNGFVILLPHMPNAHLFMVELIEEWCASSKPALFPHLEGENWLHRKEYEIPKVIELQRVIDRIEEKAKADVETLKNRITAEREDGKHYYRLLKGTGDELVQSVIWALKKIGFTKVVDVDKEEGKRREDIQIKDGSPLLIVDVKGVAGHPEDSESTQAEKHAVMRMREWSQTDVQPLTIINHQKHLPPHDRDPIAYRDEIVKNAEDTGLGLMTTWEIFKILRNMERLNWLPVHVKPIFYRTGRIEAVPEHYTPVGKIEKIWSAAFRLNPSMDIEKDSRLAIESGDEFIEIRVNSIQVDQKEVEVAPEGLNSGIGSSDTTGFKIGNNVFLIQEG